MGDVATLAIRVTSKDVEVTKKRLKELGLEVRKVTKDVDNFSGRMKRSAGEFSSAAKVIGRDLSRYITLPFLAASGAALKFSKDLTSGLGDVETLIAGTGDRIYELQTIVTDISKETGVAFDNLTRGLYETISAFQDGEDTAGRFETAVRAAVAGNADVLDSVKLLSAVTKAYGDTSQEAAERVANLAFETVRLGQTTFADLSNAIQGVTANANRLGVTQEELFSVYATLTGVTGDASNVTTQFSRALLSLANPTADLQALFAQYNTEQGEVVKTGKEFIEVTGGAVQAFKAIYDEATRTGKPLQKYITRQTGVIAVTALANQQFDTFIEKSSQVAEATGAMEDAYFAATQGIDEFQFILRQVRQTLATVGAEIGQVILPTIVVIARQIADAAERFSALDEETQSLTIRMFGLAAAMGPVLIAFGSLLRIVKLFGDLRILGASGALGFLANPAVLIAVAAAVALVAVAFGKWYKATMLQVEALKNLREASTAFNTANTEFLQLIQSTADMTNEAERNNEIIYELSQTYGDDFANSLDVSTASLNDIYQEFLKIRALDFQAELDGQRGQLEQLQKELNRAADNYTDFKDAIPSNILQEFGGDVQAVADALNEGQLNFGDFGIIDNLSVVDTIGFIEAASTSLDAFNNKRGDLKTFFDELQRDIEQRSGDMLTLQRQFDRFGVEYTSEILVVPKGDLEDAVGLGNDLAGAVGEGFASGGARRKTWADYFAEITGVAGEAFAQIEMNAEGASVGFARGSGRLAAEAYAKAFADELESTQTIAEAVGSAFSLEDQRDIYERQLDKATSDLFDLLNEKVATGELNTEGLQFNIADLLTGDETSVERMLEVFGLADSSIQGMIKTANELRESFNEANLAVILSEMNAELADFRANADNAFSFQQDEDYFKALQESASTLQTELDRLFSEETLDWNAIVRLQDEIRKIKKETEEASTAFEVMDQKMNELPSIADAVGNAVAKLAEEIGLSAEASWALGKIVGGVVGAMVSQIGDLANSFGELHGYWVAGADASKDWNDVLGEMTLSLAETMAQLAVAAGLQLIIQGNTGLGLALLLGGLAGQFAIGATRGFIAGEEQNREEERKKEEEERKRLEQNAIGGVYSGSQKLTKYAKGGVLGSYVNSIVDKPTYFANGTAVMGEAGAEAIMPLTRTSSGDLGVQAVGMGSGGSPTVSININNYASDSTEATASQNADGSIDVDIVKKMVSNAISDGSTDNAMKSRYGVGVRGIN